MDEEHYLLALIGRSRTNIEGPLFLGEDITYTTNETIFYEDYAQIIEVKGPLFDIVSSINETLSNHEFEIYPNICSSNTGVNIELPSDLQGNSMIKILDLTGSQLYSERITATNNLHHLSLPDMKSGTKIVLIESEGQVYKSILTIIN